jgi:hypothetical protein
MKNCFFCGDKIVYAKGLCRKCYFRNRLNGSLEYKRKPSKYVGRVLNGWEIISTNKQNGFVVKCEKCGETKNVWRSVVVKNCIAPCLCSLKKNIVGTNRQEEIWNAWEQNGRSFTKVGQILNLKRQRVHYVIRQLSRPHYLG